MSMPSVPRKFRLRDLLIFVFLVAVLSSIGIQILAARRWQSRETACASNLRALWGCAFNYANQRANYVDSDSLLRMPEDTGADFFMRLQKEYPPLKGRYVTFTCPISGEASGPGRTSYRGPATFVSNLRGEDPIAADKEGNHGRGRGGNVLVRMGDVSHYEETDPIWIRARITTKE